VKGIAMKKSLKKWLLIVPGADHCMSYLTEKAAYERTAKEFFNFCER